jgi:hypothetical protein
LCCGLQLDGRIEVNDQGKPTVPHPLPPRDPAAPQTPAQKLWGQYTEWAASVYDVPDKPINAPLDPKKKETFKPPPPPPLPLLPHLLLFGTRQDVPQGRVVFKATVRSEKRLLAEVVAAGEAA